MWAINMDVEDTVGENQSGIAKVIDRQAQYDTLYNISSVVFDLILPNQLYFINKLMFGVEAQSAGKDVDKNLPIINKPTQFDVSSTSELINNFSIAQKSGLDRNYLQLRQIQIAGKDLATDPDLMKKTQLMLDLDPLPMTLPAEYDYIARFTEESKMIIHVNLKEFLQRALQENKDFVNLDRSKQLEILESYANATIEEQKMKMDGLTIPDDTGNTGQGA
jgi:hypothetical protein